MYSLCRHCFVTASPGKTMPDRARASRQPLNSRASLTVLRNAAEGPDSGCQLLTDTPPSLLLTLPATFIPTPRSQWTRSFACTGCQEGGWASKKGQRVSAVGVLTLCTREKEPPPWARSQLLNQVRIITGQYVIV